MSIVEELRALIPAVYLHRDAEAQQHGALAALLEVLGAQGDVVSTDLERLYANLFIETCDPWVVPYIGDLLGVRAISPVAGSRSLSRAYVANTIGYRRRKGTPAVLEELARDVTGWGAKVAEGFHLLATTQNINHRRLQNVRTPDLRDAVALEALGGPFETGAHTADVRRPPTSRYGITDIALFLWRIETFRVSRVTARPASDPADGRYHLDPLGLDIALFNPPLPETSITSLAQARHVPAPLRRRALCEELEARRAGVAPGALSFFGVDPVIEVFADTGAGLAPVPPEQLTAADLSDPPPSVTSGWRRPMSPVVAAVDPELGRLSFPEGTIPTAVEVSYTYGAPAPIGAGPYDRSGSRTDEVIAAATFARVVGEDAPAITGLVEASLADAVTAWNSMPAGTTGVIAVLDDRSRKEDLAVSVPAGSTLLVTAGVWPDLVDEVAASPRIERLQLDERRPHLLGSVTITGGAGGGDFPPRGDVVIDGLLVEGDVVVAGGDLGHLDLLHVTVAPAGTVGVTAGNTELTVTIANSVVDAVGVAHEGPRLDVSTTIVGADVDVAAADVSLDSVTVLGDVTCRSMGASDCIFAGTVTVERRQTGCVRFSYVDAEARTPRRYRCQPDVALHPPATTVDAPAVRARLTPQFTSTRLGDAGFAQLGDRCAPELLTGSSRRSDMGAFASLARPDRESNLRVALDEYLRVGLDAGAFHES